MAEVDPVADFLAKEKDELAGLEIDDALQSVPPPLPETVDSQEQQVDDFFGADLPKEDIDISISAKLGDLNLGEDDDFLEMSGGGEKSASPEPVEPPPTTQMSAPAPAAVEPEKLRKWRVEQKERLEKKDAEEEEQKEQMRQQAKKDLEEFYKNRAEQLEAARKANRQAERELISERDEETPGLQDWERIAKLCEFNPKSSKNSKDTSRMRSLLLQLKAGEKRAE